MNYVGEIGAVAVLRWKRVRAVAALVWTVLFLSLRADSWPRTVRNVFARQMLFTGFEALRFILIIAVLIGISVVVQAQVLLGKIGQAELLGPILVAVIIREAGPLLVNFTVIGRSGTAIATELANMRVHQEIRIMEGQGINLLTYLMMPRILGVAV